MQGFDDWLASTTMRAAKEYGSVLQSFGVSHHTFRREAKELVQEFVAQGVPSIAAADIVHAAKKFFAQQTERAQLPLAVLWDVENIRIPSGMTGDVVARAIRQKLAPFGHLTIFNAYFEVNAGHMTPEKRSALQLAGCHIIDTPHMTRKEVADKVILVDAMLFVLENRLKGGTICFVTGDTDYAYLLSRLSEFPQFRTVLVSQRASKDVLHMSASSVLTWGGDILAGAPLAVPQSSVGPLGHGTLPHRHVGPPPPEGGRSPPPEEHVKASPSDRPLEAQPRTPAYTVQTMPGVGSYSDLSAEEEQMESASLLRRVMFDFMAEGQSNPLKSQVSYRLKQKNPLRFGAKESRLQVIENALDPEKGFLGSSGVGGWTAVYLKEENTGSPMQDK